MMENVFLKIVPIRAGLSLVSVTSSCELEKDTLPGGDSSSAHTLHSPVFQPPFASLLLFSGQPVHLYRAILFVSA